MVKFERRGDTTRIEFKCGKRALADYRDKNDVINRLVMEMTVGYWELSDAFQRLRDENKTLQFQLKAAREQLSAAEAVTLRGSAVPYRDGQIISRVFEGRDISDLRLLAQKLAAQPGTIVLFGLAGDKAQLLFGRAENVNLDVAPLLKAALARINSDRGGGRPNFAQGGGVPATADAVLATIQAAEQTIRAAN